MSLIIKSRFMEDPIESQLNITEHIMRDRYYDGGQLEQLVRRTEQLATVLTAVLNHTSERGFIAIASELGYDVEYNI